MDLNKPSFTMQAVCAVRIENANLLGVDPIASKIIFQLNDGQNFKEILDRFSNGMFSRSVLLRSLYFSKILKATENQYSQLIILSAGLDFRFLNYSGWKKSKVFLIDHPASLELTRSLIKPYAQLLSNVSYIEADFNTVTFERINKAMLDNGFNKNLPTAILWEGATYYFSPEVVFKMLTIINNLCTSHLVAADFADQLSWSKIQAKFTSSKPEVQQNSSIEQQEQQNEAKEALTFLQKNREPWLGYFDQAGVKQYLSKLGYNKLDIIWEDDFEKNHLPESYMENKSMFYITATHT